MPGTNYFGLGYFGEDYLLITSGDVTGTLAATLGSLTASFAGDHGVTSSVAATLPNLTAAFAGEEVFTGSLAATLPLLNAAASGDVGVTGTEAATLAALVAAFTGNHGVSGALAATLAPLTASLAGNHGVAGASAAQLPGITANFAGEFVAASGAVEGVMAGVMPLLQAAFTGDLDVVAPPLSGGGYYRPLGKQRPPAKVRTKKKPPPIYGYIAGQLAGLTADFAGAALPPLEAEETAAAPAPNASKDRTNAMNRFWLMAA